MSLYSPYAVAEDVQPTWRPGERETCITLIGITFYIVLEINVEIFRAFKRRTGLYFWSVQIGSVGIAVATIGVIVKFLVAGAARIWGFYTFLMMIGWLLYVTAQSLVLYSRLHLVLQNAKIHRVVLGFIISTIFTLQLPTWIMIFHAYNSNPEVSSVWSPREAIVERYQQLSYTGLESLLSGFYIWALSGLLKHKSGVRQHRVMMDLIYVNLIIIVLDILLVILIYLNQLGLSHPIQLFSYAVKLRLEFLVLNQLMAVAARGLRSETYTEKRYHKSSMQDDHVYIGNSGSSRPKPMISPEKRCNSTRADFKSKFTATDPTEVSVPRSAHLSEDQSPTDSISPMHRPRLDDLPRTPDPLSEQPSLDDVRKLGRSHVAEGMEDDGDDQTMAEEPPPQKFPAKEVRIVQRLEEHRS